MPEVIYVSRKKISFNLSKRNHEFIVESYFKQKCNLLVIIITSFSFMISLYNIIHFFFLIVNMPISLFYFFDLFQVRQNELFNHPKKNQNNKSKKKQTEAKKKQ